MQKFNTKGKMYQSFADLAGLADVAVTEAATQADTANEPTNIFDMPFADRFKGQDAGDKAINEEDPSVTTNSNWDEASLIEAINHSFNEAYRFAEETKAHRVKAGELLIEASKHVPAGEWGRWCKVNVKRSERDIRKVMKLAGAADPQGAVKAEREQNREARDKRREQEQRSSDARKVNNADQSAPPPPQSSQGSQDTEVASLQAEVAKWKEECARLADNFMERTTEWMEAKRAKEALEEAISALRFELHIANKASSVAGKATFTKEEWLVLIKCLHPDSSPSQELKTQATQLLNVRRDMLVRVTPTTSPAEDEAFANAWQERQRQSTRRPSRKAA